MTQPGKKETDEELVVMIQDAASRFLRSEYSQLLEPRAEAGSRIWSAFAELGWLALPVEVQLGGFGGGLRETGVLFEAFGRHLAVHPYLDAVLAADIFQGLEDDAQKAQLLASLMDGSSRTALATMEKADTQQFSSRATRLSESSGVVTISGHKHMVLFAEAATQFLVSAQGLHGDDGQFSLCLVDASVPGVEVSHLTRIDGCPAASVRFSNVPAQIVASGKLAKTLAVRAENSAMILNMAEVIGAVRQLFDLTRDYLNAREQYGRKLSAFQALRMRMADLLLEAELAEAYLSRAVRQLQSEAIGNELPLMALGVKSMVAETARRLAREAVQLHGAVGFTQEALPGRYLKRIEALSAAFGTPEACLQQYVARMLAGQRVAPVEGFFSTEDQAFAEEVRAFVKEALAPDIERKVRCGLPLYKEDYVRWQKALFEKGWIAGSWPKKFGGAEWTPARQYIFQSEAGRLNAPDVLPYGVKMVGPVLYTFGTPEQQAEHLPGVLSSDVWWCQGYSEPNAGSDLASLRTRAEREGDYYVVNGTKIWTTQAHYADKMHCLVRTGDPKERHSTITFLLIDMKAPGVSVRPIESIDGLHHLNQVFFDSVRVPVGQRVGAEGDGWKIATFLLAHERAALAKVAHKERILRRVRQLLESRSAGLSASGELLPAAARLAKLEMRLHALEFLELQYLMHGERSALGKVHGSILKVLGTELQQALTELAVDLLGPDLQAYEIQALEEQDAPLAAQSEASAVYEYLYNRAASIYGGTSEIQRTILAKEIFQS